MNLNNKAILATMEAKPEHAADLESLLKSALALANQEQGTVTWFAFKLSDTEFAIFDTFADDAGRQAHLNGDIAKALLAKADQWLQRMPAIREADVLAAKLSS